MQDVHRRVDEDVLSVPTAVNTSGFRTKTTVGMMLQGCTIDNMVCAFKRVAKNNNTMIFRKQVTTLAP
jgi:hypothetical protein